MTEQYDAIIIGAGITGACIAYELAQKGCKTVNADKLEAAGCGSTGNTCAIIRTHYSTLEGTALAYDSYFYWKKWADYINTQDEKGLARFHETGVVVVKPKSFNFDKYLKLHDQLNIPYQVWDHNTLLQKMPHFTDASFYPPKRPDDPLFGESPADKINSAVIFSLQAVISMMQPYPYTLCKELPKRMARRFCLMLKLRKSELTTTA